MALILWDTVSHKYTIGIVMCLGSNQTCYFYRVISPIIPNWCISSPHDCGRQSFYNVSAVIYKTKDFVMFVAVNNDIHNIPVLVNKETVVKLRNSFELSMNTERLLKTRKHGGTLYVSSVIGHLTGSRNEILSRYRFDVCWHFSKWCHNCKVVQANLNIQQLEEIGIIRSSFRKIELDD